MVRSVLAREGFAVEVAGSGNEAISRLISNHYDAVVLDVMMPDGSGHEVLQVLKVQRPAVKCVVIISAAAAARLEEVDVSNVGAKLRKPFDIEELIGAVQNCVGPVAAPGSLDSC